MLRWEQRHHADQRLVSLASGHLPFSLIPWFIWGQDSSYPCISMRYGAASPHVCISMSAHAPSRVWVHCSDAEARTKQGRWWLHARVSTAACPSGPCCWWVPKPDPTCCCLQPQITRDTSQRAKYKLWRLIFRRRLHYPAGVMPFDNRKGGCWPLTAA